MGIDLTVAGESWSIANIICNLRSGLFSMTKNRILKTALRDTDSGSQPQAEATFNVPGAMAARSLWAAARNANSGQRWQQLFRKKQQKYTSSGDLYETSVTTATSSSKQDSSSSDSVQGMTIFEQAFEQLGSLPDSQLRVHGETVFKCNMLGLSVQGTGPYRQVLTDLCEELQSPGLLFGSPLIANLNSRLDKYAMNSHTMLTNPSAGSRRSLAMLEFLGKLIGIAIRNSSTGTVLPLSFTSVFWKQISRERMTREDLQGVDHYLYDRLEEIVNARNPEEFCIILERLADDELLHFDGNFTARLSCGRQIELVPGGKRIALTFENRKLFARILMRSRLSESRVQMAAVRRGLACIVPMAQLLRLFTWRELEVMVCGEEIVNLKLLREQTRYTGVFEGNEDHRVVQWFWEVLEERDNAGRAEFLKFAWARTRLPLTADEFPRKMELCGDSEKEADSLPHSATCFFRVTISPHITSKAMLKEKLNTSILHGDLDGDDMGSQEVDRSNFEDLLGTEGISVRSP